MSADSYDFKAIEPEMLNFWDKHSIYRKAKEKNKGGKKFYFLDGPPYTSGKAHLGHALNKALKDCALRFLRMRGLDVWDRAGYDMHGLPTEREVEKKLGIRHKEEIPKFGIAKYIEECRAFSIKNMHSMNSDFRRIGVWMDFENAYQPIENSYIEGEWWLIKKAHENKRLYEGLRTIGWCKKCGTALAKHELEYMMVSEPSIFVKFPLLDDLSEQYRFLAGRKVYMVIWTTTPWTLPANLAVALLTYILLYILVVSLSLPGGLVLTVTGGLLFGWLAGALAAIVGATTGATIIFLIARSSFGEPLAALRGLAKSSSPFFFCC